MGRTSEREREDAEGLGLAALRGGGGWVRVAGTPAGLNSRISSWAASRSGATRVSSRFRVGPRSQADVAGVPRCARAPYPSHIWAGYGGCQSAWAFEDRLRGPSGSKFYDRTATRRPAGMFETGLSGSVVDALTRQVCVL